MVNIARFGSKDFRDEFNPELRMPTTDGRVSCPVCGAADLFEVREAVDPRFESTRRFKVLWCAHCELGSTHPRLSLLELRQYYPDQYDPYREELIDCSRRRFHRLLILAEERFGPAATDRISPGVLLDVGCGSGRYMAAMARRGFSVTGVEISPRASEIVAKKGLPVVNGDFLAVDLPWESFSVITMNHYLEHAIDPRASLQKARALLKHGGQLIVGVPNFSSWASRHFGPYWSDLELPRHTFHFGPRGLTRLLVNCGFRVDRVRHEPAAEAGSVITSLLVKARKRNDPLAQMIYPVLHAACYPIGLPIAVLRKSAWIRVFSTKA